VTFAVGPASGEHRESGLLELEQFVSVTFCKTTKNKFTKHLTYMFRRIEILAIQDQCKFQAE
jgi:hypothetical protein